MNYLKQFEISFKGLKIGDHQFDFNIDKLFFDNFEFSEVKEGKVSVNLLFQKNERMMILEFTIKGHVKLICDRCLESFNYPVKSKERLIVKFGQEENTEESEEILILQEEDHKIDVSHLIYEYIILSLPIKRVHVRAKDCNSEIISKLNKINIKDNVDPRWEALKKLKTKNK